MTDVTYYVALPFVFSDDLRLATGWLSPPTSMPPEPRKALRVPRLMTIASMRRKHTAATYPHKLGVVDGPMRKNFSLDVTDPLDSQIATLCGRVEALVPGCRAGVCIASADHTKLERSVFPNLPPTFQQAIKELPMGPPYIGCCTAAMHGKRIITVHDLEKESRFSDVFIATCLSHGIRSLRSRPVYGRADAPIGTFVMGYGEPSDDQRFDLPYIDFAADAVGAMLQRELDRTRGPLSSH